MRTIAIGAHLWSLTLSLVLLFSAAYTFWSNSAFVARVAELVASKTPQWIGYKQVNLNLQVAYAQIFGQVRCIESEKQGVCRGDSIALLQSHPANCNYILFP